MLHGDLNTGLHNYTASTLSTEPPPLYQMLLSTNWLRNNGPCWGWLKYYSLLEANTGALTGLGQLGLPTRPCTLSLKYRITSSQAVAWQSTRVLRRQMETGLLQEYAGSGLSSSSHDLSSHGFLVRLALLNTHPCTVDKYSSQIIKKILSTEGGG